MGVDGIPIFVTEKYVLDGRKIRKIKIMMNDRGVENAKKVFTIKLGRRMKKVFRVMYGC